MNIKPYLRNQRYRVIESAVKSITDYVPEDGLTFPTTLQVVVIAKADTPATDDAITINGRTFGAPALKAGAVWKYDFFSKGSLAICNAAYDLAVNIGLGRYHKL